jgi:hypothetical protein
VQFFGLTRSDDVIDGVEAIGATKEDGSFQVAVPPGKGHLLVLGPTSDYVPKEISSRSIYGEGLFGEFRHYAHDIIAYDFKAGEAVHELTATLRPGKTVRGRVVGPEGQIVERAVIFTRHNIDPINLIWPGHPPFQVRDGRFELHGLDPEQSAPVYFFDAGHQWGTTIELTGNPGGGEVTIRLQPCGQARARFVGPDGKPVAKLGLWPYFDLLMTPGSHSLSRAKADRDKLHADSILQRGVDFQHYGNTFVTDAEGRVTLPALIPGALYRLSDYSSLHIQDQGVQVRKEFRVKPGETLELGDILIEKPPSS